MAVSRQRAVNGNADPTSRAGLVHALIIAVKDVIARIECFSLAILAAPRGYGPRTRFRAGSSLTRPFLVLRIFNERLRDITPTIYVSKRRLMIFVNRPGVPASRLVRPTEQK